jgi:hypothetical protein
MEPVPYPTPLPQPNGTWEPIPTGTFTIPLGEPNQDPSLCEEWEGSP